MRFTSSCTLIRFSSGLVCSFNTYIMTRDTRKYRILINCESRASNDVWFLRSSIGIRHDVTRRYACVVWRVVRRIHLSCHVYQYFAESSCVCESRRKEHEIFAFCFLYCTDRISLSSISVLLSRPASADIVHDPVKFSPRFSRRVTLATVVFLRFAVESSLALIRTASASCFCASVPSMSMSRMVDNAILVIRSPFWARTSST